MFKVEITKRATIMQGTDEEMIVGLACYVDALKENGVSEKLIRKAVESGLKDDQEEIAAQETLLNDKEMEELIEELIEEINKEIEKLQKKIFD